ncbi:hypothetical protein BB561_006474 [Smittium simulii]|uniref:Uncharacterized protein n=1 Tax=Smittium simulii TaxID=133385 RepID=A0A2T9Y3W9_9FUNG|nr:hypothetical protein BB561_006474 [Smittium simulii]
MDQLVGTQAPAGQDQVMLLPELLTEALPSIKEDFFKLPLTEEEQKMAIHSCPKTSSMNYNPPPLNGSATSALTLVQATRPIDYYVHRITQKNPGLNTAEDSATMFASTMRALLAYIAATVTQARIDNLHGGLDLPKKPTGLIKTEIKPLIDQETLDALLAKKPTVKRQRVRPFCRRQQYTIPTDTYSSNTATAPSTIAVTTEAGFNNRSSDRQANFCGRADGFGHSTKGIQNSLQEPSLSRIGVVGIKKTAKGQIVESDNTNSKTTPALSDALWARSELQNGNAFFNCPNDTTQGLHDVVGLQGCFSTHTGVREVQKISTIPLEREGIPIQSLSLWPVFKPISIHQGASFSFFMGQKTRHKNICIPGRFSDSGRVPKRRAFRTRN